MPTGKASLGSRRWTEAGFSWSRLGVQLNLEFYGDTKVEDGRMVALAYFVTTSTTASRHDVGGSFLMPNGGFFQRVPLVMKRRRGSLFWAWRSAWELQQLDWSFFWALSHVKLLNDGIYPELS